MMMKRTSSRKASLTNRPTSLAKTCLAYFAVWFVTLYKKGTDRTDESDSDYEPKANHQRQ
ncbi:hypothetical protein DPMN_127208 [Dreissena polymorpha]|uniref:Uncharacterized protein n=1 Tax=Dreissena polymorpha TaxID=45954 RepID=A0A9D4JYX8_DREPO|nr:hypothetical protein DPMN_127208 [Dreissena polymorpha]